MSKSASPGTAVTGLNLTYTIVVFNAGPATAAGILLTDPLPAGTVFVSCATSQGICAGPPVGTNGTVSAILGSLNPSASATLVIVVNVTASSGTLTNTVTVTSTTPDPTPADNTATVSTPLNAAIPTLDPPMLLAFGALLAALALALLRRT